MRLFSVLMLGFLLCLTGCPTQTTRRVVAVSIVSSGTVVTQLRRANEDAYARTADQARLQASSLAAYDRAMEPVDAAFMQRTQALAIISRALFTAARVLDQTRDGGTLDVVRTAQEVLSIMDPALRVLQEPGALPPLAMPEELLSAIRAMRTIAQRTEARDE